MKVLGDQELKNLVIAQIKECILHDSQNMVYIVGEGVAERPIYTAQKTLEEYSHLLTQAEGEQLISLINDRVNLDSLKLISDWMKE